MNTFLLREISKNEAVGNSSETQTLTMYVSINFVRISWCVADDFQPVPAKSAQQSVQRIWRWAPLFFAGSDREHCIRFVGWFSRPPPPLTLTVGLLYYW